MLRLRQRHSFRAAANREGKEVNLEHDPDYGQISEAFKQRRETLHSSVRYADPQEAEDVYQDAFVRVLERSCTAKIDKLENFLKRVARCIAIDRLRRKISRSTVTAGDAGDKLLDISADPERSLIGAQRLSRAIAVISCMPERRREVFMLHRIDELTYVQIARKLGVSIKTVEKHMTLAMRQLSDADD